MPKTRSVCVCVQRQCVLEQYMLAQMSAFEGFSGEGVRVPTYLGI